MNAAPLAPPSASAPTAQAARSATPAKAGSASDDAGGFAAALDAARTQTDPAEADAGAPAPSVPAGDRADSQENDPDPAATAGTPSDLAPWLPGWPPTTAAVATATGATLPGDGTDPAAAKLASALAGRSSDAPRDAAGSLDPEAAIGARAAGRPIPTAADTLAAPSARGLARPSAPAIAAAAAAAEPGMERAQLAGRAGDPTPSVPIDVTRPAEAATPLPWPATMGLAARDASPATNSAGVTPSAPFEARLGAALDSAAFAPALATQIKWLVTEGVQHARLSLNPAEMGPLAVQIMLDGRHARIDFSAEVAATRSAIEASLPTLAAALHQSGLTLAGGGVFDGQARQGAQGERGAHAPASGPGTAASGAETLSALPLRAVRGLVDLVA